MIKRSKICEFAILLSLTALLVTPLMAVQAQEPSYFFSFHVMVGAQFDVEVQAMEMLKPELAKIGINMIIDTVEWATIEQARTTDTRTYAEGGWDAAVAPIEMDGAPEYSSQFHSRNIPPPGENWFSFNNGLSDVLLDTAKTEMDPQKRLELYYQWQEIYLDELPAIGLYIDKGVYLFSDEVSDEAVEFAINERPALSDPTWVLQKVEIPGTDTLIFPESFPNYFLIPVLGWSYNAGCFLTLTKLQQDMEVGPGIICQSYEWSSDFKTVTFHLTSGMKWADGEPFTSADVKFTYEAIMNPDTNAVYYSKLNEDIESIETPNDLTVVIKLKKNDAFFLETLARYAGMEIVPKHILENVPYSEWHTSDYNTKTGLPGLGPWSFVEKVEGQYYKWQRNQYYYEKFGYPKMEYIIEEQIDDRQTALAALENGEVHFLDTFYYWHPDVETLENTPGIKVGVGPRLDLYALHINGRHPILSNKYVRRAIAYAAPRDKILSDLVGGLGVITDIPYPEGFYARNPELEPGYYEYDLNKAKESMQMAGFNYDWLEAQEAPVPYEAYGIGLGIGVVVTAVIMFVAFRVRKTSQ